MLVRVYFLALIAAGFSIAATRISIDSTGITATQAIIRVATDQAGNCTYRVSEGASFAAPVNDVNGGLFPGSDSDSRFGALVNANSHVFVAGTRTSARASNGRYYSRALQANTQHWVGVTCGTDQEVSATFITLNPPPGNTAPDPMPFDAKAFGNVAVPSIDWRNKAQPYIDPLTGFKLLRATGPDDNGFMQTDQAFATGLDPSGHWQNPGGSASGGRSFATCDTNASCTPNDALFVTFPDFKPFYRSVGGWTPGSSIADMLARAWGSGTGSTPEMRTVSVCWSIDSGRTCFTNAQDIVLPTSNGYAGTAPPSWRIADPYNTLKSVVVKGGTATVNLTVPHGLNVGGTIVINGVRNQSVQTGIGGNGLNGAHAIASVPDAKTLTFTTNAGDGTYTDSEMSASTGFPLAQWQSWGAAPMRADIGVWSGNANVANSVVIPNNASASSNLFNLNWTPGTKIYIAGSAPACANSYCTIKSLDSTRQITIVEDPGSLSNAAWQSANSGLRVVKKTTGAAVSVSFNYDYAVSSSWNSGLDGSGDICNANPVQVSVDRDGNSLSSPLSGYLCVFPASAGGQNTGNVFLFVPSTGETRLIAHQFIPGDDYTTWTGWHPTDGRSWYTHKGNTSFLLTTYHGDFREFRPGYIESSAEPPVPEQLTFTDAFAGSDLITQIRNCKAAKTCDTPINENVFTLPGTPPQAGSALVGFSMILCGAGGGDAPGFVVHVDMSKTPAQVVRVEYSWDKFPIGYGGIHACLGVGTGKWNQISFNAQLGQSWGRFGGPHQLLIKQVDKGNGWVNDANGSCGSDGIGTHCDTSLTENDGFECPADLDPRWQILGAKPVSQGGAPLCLKYKVAGEPCSANAYDAAESSNFPCPWNSSPSYSLLKPVGEGDTIHDAGYGFTSYGEFQLVVRKTVNALQDIDLLVFRYRLAPNSGFTCGGNPLGEARHSNGWIGHMAPYFSCPGALYWQDVTDPARKWYTETANLGGHQDFGPGAVPGSYTSVGGAYVARPNLPLPYQIGVTAPIWVNGDPPFAGATSPDVFMQSYPSKRQNPALTPAAEMNWALDTRHYNPSYGCGSECGERLFDNVETNISGTAYDPAGTTRQVWKITLPSLQRVDFKRLGFIGWAGWHMLGDMSGPGSLIGDANSYRYCYAYAADECRPGSTASDIFVSVPGSIGSCVVNWYTENGPCLSMAYTNGGWNTQTAMDRNDPAGAAGRRLTTGFVAPGRQYNFTNSKPTPDGQWAVVESEWLEGQRTDLFWVKLTPWTAASTAGNDFVRLSIKARSPQKAVQVRARFGYMENEPVNSSTLHFYGTTRAEATTTETNSNNDPFSFLSDTARAAYPCAHGCSLAIPVIPGRVVYYVLDWLDSQGNVLQSNAPDVAAAWPGSVKTTPR